MKSDLFEKLDASDVSGAIGRYNESVDKGADPWEIHLSLFPVVQRVLNPPFINPHLPKMYRIYREFIPYLKKDEIPAFVKLEVNEYAQRPKLNKLPKVDLPRSLISFAEVEAAIRKQDWEKTTAMMATFYSQKGGMELARRLLLLGSGYLDDSLGHSVSCTAFILLEMIERQDQDPWPALATLADYFCKGKFETTPSLRKSKSITAEEDLRNHLFRATTGLGIVNLHHTITRYAIERVHQFLSPEEQNHMILSWISFMADKGAKQTKLDPSGVEPEDYDSFYKVFSRLEPKPVAAIAEKMIVSEQGRKDLGRFLINGLSDLYQGNYNPHYLTGLGSALWVVDRYWSQPPIVVNALFQYLNYFFEGIRH